MTGRKYLLTLRRNASEYGVFLAVIVAIWLCFFIGARWFWDPGFISSSWYFFNGFSFSSNFSRMLVPSFTGIFSFATCIYFIIAGTQTTKDMRNLSQMGTTRKTSLLISLSQILGLVLISALIGAVTGNDMILSFGWRFMFLMVAFLLCYGTTFLFNAITTYFRPLVSTLIIVALVILPNPFEFLLDGVYSQLIAAILEIGVGTILFLTRASMLKSENV